MSTDLSITLSLCSTPTRESLIIDVGIALDSLTFPRDAPVAAQRAGWRIRRDPSGDDPDSGGVPDPGGYVQDPAGDDQDRVEMTQIRVEMTRIRPAR